MEENTGFIPDGNEAVQTQAQESGSPGSDAQFVETDSTPDESNQGNDGPGNPDSTQDTVAESPKWKAQVRDDLKANKVLDQYGDLNALADAHLELLDGKSGELAVPDDDDAEAWGKLYDTLGRPEKSENYQLAEDLKLSDSAAAEIKDLAHEMGLNQKQFDKLQAVMQNASQYDQALQEAMYKGTVEDAQKALKSEWGEKFDERYEFMKRGAKELITPEFRKVLAMHNQLNNPEIAKALANYGEFLAEDMPAGESPSGGESTGWSYPED